MSKTNQRNVVSPSAFLDVLSDVNVTELSLCCCCCVNERNIQFSAEHCKHVSSHFRMKSLLLMSHWCPGEKNKSWKLYILKRIKDSCRKWLVNHLGVQTEGVLSCWSRYIYCIGSHIYLWVITLDIFHFIHSTTLSAVVIPIRDRNTTDKSKHSAAFFKKISIGGENNNKYLVLPSGVCLAAASGKQRTDI